MFYKWLFFCFRLGWDASFHVSLFVKIPGCLFAVDDFAIWIWKLVYGCCRFFFWARLIHRFEVNNIFSFVPKEGALGSDAWFSSWAAVHMVDFSEIRKTPEGCVSLVLPSKSMLTLSEFQWNVKEETFVAVELVLSLSPVCQIDLSKI